MIAEPPRAEGSESFLKVIAPLLGVLAVLVGLAVMAQPRRGKTIPAPPPAIAQAPAPDPAPIPTPEPEPEPAKVVDEPPPPPTLDVEAVGRAEAARDAARRDREQAEARLEEAEARLAESTRESAEAEEAARSLVGRVEDPGTRVRRVSNVVEILDAERRKIGAELAALEQAPKPKRKPLLDRTPVARPAEGDEYHFEIRRDRVAFIDLERLLEKVKADARLRLRMNDSGRPIVSTVGPVGAFSLTYELGRTLPEAIEDLLDSRAAASSYALRGWEVVPNYEGRGETFEVALQPAAEFARAVNRLHPAKATITFWIYPDGFALFRKLRDVLHERGFTVAARPLPEGISIRGSPGGSLSAGQ